MSKYLGMKANFDPEVRAALEGAGARIATAHEHAHWTVGYLHSGRDVQDYDFPSKATPDNSTVYVATKDCHFPGLWGDKGVTVIVPEGVNVTYDMLGNNRLLYMKDFSQAAMADRTVHLAPKVMKELFDHNYPAERFIWNANSSAEGRAAIFNSVAEKSHVTDRALQAGVEAPVGVTPAPVKAQQRKL